MPRRYPGCLGSSRARWRVALSRVRRSSALVVACTSERESARAPPNARAHECRGGRRRESVTSPSRAGMRFVACTAGSCPSTSAPSSGWFVGSISEAALGPRNHQRPDGSNPSRCESRVASGPRPQRRRSTTSVTTKSASNATSGPNPGTEGETGWVSVAVVSVVLAISRSFVDAVAVLLAVSLAATVTA